MLIISDLRGQLCNRIFLTAYGMALAEETGQTFFDFSFEKYAPLFPKTRRSRWWNLFYRPVRLLLRALVKLLWISPLRDLFVIDVTYKTSLECSPGNPTFVARLRGRYLTFLRVDQYFDLSKIQFPKTEPIRAKFTPDTSVLDLARAHVAKVKGDTDVLVGVHIRRGDYDIHLNGRHYFPFEFYRRTMDRMVELFPGRRVSFLICSTDTLPEDIFRGSNYQLGPGSILGDLYALAECDYLLGPPSTFTLWAAFFGRKPVCHLIRQEVPSGLDQFMVPDGHFECYDLNTI